MKTNKTADDVVLTTDSHDLFMAYAKDASNWSGMPLVGGNVGGSRKDNGNLTDLKKNGLITTHRDEGCDWVSFTDLGLAYAAKNDVTIDTY